MKSLLFFFLVFLGLTCMSDSKSSINKSQELKDSVITIIINNPTGAPLQIGFKNRFNDNELLYFNKVSDTIIMKGFDFLPLRVEFAKKIIAFPMFSGESILFTINDSQILDHQNLNSNRKEFDTSFFDYLNKTLKKEYNRLDRLYLGKGSDSMQKKLKPSIIIIKKNNGLNSDSLFNESRKVNNMEWRIMDSLQDKNLISGKFTYIFGSIINSSYIEKIIECYKISKSDTYLHLLKSNRNLFKIEYLKYDAGRYKAMLDNYIVSIIAKDKFYKFGSNAITIDYKAAYDSAQFYFENELLEYVRFACLRKIKENSPDLEFENYFLKFSSNARDTGYLNYFKKFYGNINDVWDIIYSNNKKDSFLLEDILSKKNDKVMYLDFWASWCAPCLAAMPASEKLRKDYQDKGIKFIYLSLDENFLNWQNSSIQEGLSSWADSYLMANPKSSVFLKELNVSAIPRYLIIKNGKVINQNAPPPGSREIRDIFDAILK